MHAVCGPPHLQVSSLQLGHGFPLIKVGRNCVPCLLPTCGILYVTKDFSWGPNQNLASRPEPEN